MKRLVSIAAVVALASVVLATGADAARPSSGAISPTKRKLTWKGGPYEATDSYPVTSVAPDWCLQGRTDPMCDHFKFRINMGQGSRFRVSIRASSSGFEAIQNANANTVAPNDFDLALYDPRGVQIASDGNNTGNESVTFTLKSKFRNKYYEVRVVPFLLVPGAYYRGTITTLRYVK